MEYNFWNYYHNCILTFKKKVNFKIKPNRHRSIWFPEVILRDRIDGTITFVGDFSYSNTDRDTHKIIGFSDNWHHHKDSIRLGWRWDFSLQKIEVLTIRYSNNIRYINHLCFIENNLEKEYNFVISKNKTCYFIVFNNRNDILPRKSNWFGPRYLLFPYYGGQAKSEKKIQFIINRKAPVINWS